jgi:hypothetical protein
MLRCGSSTKFSESFGDEGIINVRENRRGGLEEKPGKIVNE